MNRLNSITPTVILLAALTMTNSTVISPAFAEPPPCRDAPQVCKEQQENRCRTMNAEMLRIMKSTPLKTERDIKDVAELIARVEKMLSDNRSRGVDECRSWGDLNHIVVHQ
jgi:hypothetical protein